MSDELPETSDEPKNALRIVRNQNSAVPTFSNNFLVQTDGPESHLRFYQIEPPIVTGGTPEERAEELRELDGKVVAQCVAHIVISNERLSEILNVLNAHAKKHELIPGGDE